jgi:hypothetical protein
MTRPAFGGNLMATIVCKDHRPQMSTVRPGVMLKGERNGDRKGAVEHITVNFDKSKFRVKVLHSVKEEKNPGPAWMPMVKMKSTSPKFPNSLGMMTPKCPNSRAMKMTAETSSESPLILILPNMKPKATIRKSAK